MDIAKKHGPVESAQESSDADSPLTSVPANDGPPEHASWSRATVELLRRLIVQQEDDLGRLRGQLCDAEARLAAASN